MRRLGLILLLAISMVQAQGQESGIHQISPAKVLKAGTVAWPGDASREALVVLEFTIGVDGLASDISVVNTGFFEKRFADAAIRMARQSTFSPKLVDGVPSPTYNVRMPVKFAIVNQPKGVTADFRREALTVVKLIRSKDYSGANFHAQWMLSDKVTLLYEYAVLQAQMANTYALVGENHAALAAAKKATERSTSEIQDFVPGAKIARNSAGNYLLPKELVLQLLELRMALADALGLSVEALEAYSQLAGLRAVPPEDRLAKTAAQLTILVLSDLPLIGRAKLDTSGNWEHQPYRSTVTIRNINAGSLKSVDMTCKETSREIQFKAEAEWIIPGPLNNCTLHFDGAPGTTFLIVETDAGADDALRSSP
jgi:hypothetical protein